MRILIQTNGIPLFNSGGYNRQIYEIIKMFYNSGHEIRLLMSGISTASNSIKLCSYNELI